jgi:TonB-like protein
MEVVDWRDSPLIVAEPRARRRVLPPTLTGILGTLLVHAIAIRSVSFGSRGPKPKLAKSQESANALSTSSADADNLILVSFPTVNAGQAAGESPISSFPDLSKLKIKSSVSADPPEFLNFETLALSEEQSPRATAGGANGAEKARVLGIYTGQIQARIDRDWRRPRTPVNEEKSSVDVGESFQCKAQIVQDVRGNVQEVMLPRCNGSLAWRNSLVLAIQHASPLPAPPSENTNHIGKRFCVANGAKRLPICALRNACVPKANIRLSVLTLIQPGCEL